MLFGLSDSKTSETFDSLEEAVAAAQKWYKNRETERVQLPPWNYQIADIFALNTAIEDYEARLAEALGYRDVYGPGNQLGMDHRMCERLSGGDPHRLTGCRLWCYRRGKILSQ